MSLTGIDLIVNDLENTELKYTRITLHVEYKYGESEKKCAYCGEGVLIKEAGVPKEVIKNKLYIESIHNYSYITDALTKRYGLNFVKSYTKPITCDFLLIPDLNISCGVHMGDLERVITHLSDHHSKSHKELARHLRELSKKYNLQTGETI